MKRYNYESPNATVMGAVAFYGVQGSPLVVVTDLEDEGLGINTAEPSYRREWEALSDVERLWTVLAMMVQRRKAEGLLS